MPSLRELQALFDHLPEVPPPLPRQKSQVATKPTSEAAAPVLDSTRNHPNLLQRIFSWILLPSTSAQPQARKPNPFAALKAGKKNIVIAAVDAGNISFFKFSQGAFSEWPMV
jgi:tRNA-splicing endonuclease subunit Sen54